METERKEKLPRGAYTRIARRHRVSVEHVRQVYMGNRTSPRIEQAIASYIEREAKKREGAA